MVSIKEKIIRYMKTEGNFHKKKTNKKIIPLQLDSVLRR